MDKNFIQKKLKIYQTPYGEIELNRKVYAPLGEGKQYCPVEKKVHIIKTATPKFAKMISYKYIHTSAKTVEEDLKNNHNRKISKSYIQTLSQIVSNSLLKQEDNWEYEIPKMSQESKDIKTISIGLDGTCMPMGETSWREAMCGTISMYNADGKRVHTLYVANAPEYGKAKFKERMNREILNIEKKFPDAKIIGVADGGIGLSEELKKQFSSMQFILDKSHLKDHLYETAEALGINQKDRSGWVEPRVRAISDGNVEAVLKELEEENDKNPNKRLKRLIGYINRFYDALDYDNLKTMGYPIGSGEIESAHKYIPQKRLKIPGASWNADSIDPMLSLRILRADDWWEDFWNQRTEALMAA
jgi:hypothetical protein